MGPFRTSVAVLVAFVVLVGGCGDGQSPVPEGPTGGQQSFRARLDPLNGSGARGEAILSLLGSTLRVQVTATGLEPGEEHVQHVHRLESGAPGACPTANADAGRDGTVDVDEALPAYGPVALPLQPFPRADRRGQAVFQGTFELPAELEPLSDRVVVVYGLEIRGVYDPTVPVACGRVR